MSVENNIYDLLDHGVDETKLDKSYKKNIDIEIPRGADSHENENGDVISTSSKSGRESIFNSHFIFSGDASNIFSDDDFAKKRNDFIKPTLMNLLKHTTGANKYDPSDFVYIDRIHELQNNRLITLRRFPYPCVDDIYTNNGYQYPDLGRMLTFFDQEVNPLNSVFNMTYGMRWKELASESESGSMVGDSAGASGMLKNTMSVIDPQYGKAAAQGGDIHGSFDKQYDQNKVYGPVDSIKETHIRDVGLHFEQPLVLTFKYELRSIDGVNPKTAFQDLLANILVVTTNDAKFWGGARYWIGYHPSKYGRDLQKQSNAAFISTMNKNHTSITGVMGGVAKSLENMLSGSGGVSNILNNVANLAFGKMLNKLGRVSVPTMNSLLNAEPVGEWHVQIGNPLRPIMSIGNLILESTNIQIYDDTLGMDDYPSGIQVEVTLKHAMPRDRASIESMFNMGSGRLYWKPTKDFIQGLKNNKANRKASMQDWTKDKLNLAYREVFSFTKQAFD